MWRGSQTEPWKDAASFTPTKGGKERCHPRLSRRSGRECGFYSLHGCCGNAAPDCDPSPVCHHRRYLDLGSRPVTCLPAPRWPRQVRGVRPAPLPSSASERKPRESKVLGRRDLDRVRPLGALLCSTPLPAPAPPQSPRRKRQSGPCPSRLPPEARPLQSQL